MSANNPVYPGWRSLLFVPGHQQQLIDKAHTRGADAIILDLEDSVPSSQKKIAREQLINAAKKLQKAGTATLVRINQDVDHVTKDLIAAISPHVDALVIPKVESATDIQTIAKQVDELETLNNMTAGHTRLLALIESVDALPRLDEIATAHPRLVAMTLGSEDFCATAYMRPNTTTLMLPSQMIAFACRRAGISPLGFPGSIADYNNSEAFSAAISIAKQLGMVGAFCIHPKQVGIINTGLAATADEIENAHKLIEAFAAAEELGLGAIEFQGKMVDMPVVLRAKELLNLQL
ncbi:CoA ester lyase [Dasania sp. GY-MA-18]|uniref:CoA ester lyase n=1 Tax=Dasania phycosphaerae TaxID=2950436 RepID=A0A9J6RP38_9GAMM|nr:MULTISPECIES: CoA ester lyase [Dasania]MCR8923518.1 CoA ester lyase [Dasania sp. GY-MA-18]MCZ0865952.1 CoA ester lyase [Dasania phycosphaerae]MCZ0869676.1 CoA ester lyase [Dasania phycosphaerae]